MNTETKKALEGSIAKWQAIVDGTGRDYGTENCPLCSLFFYGDIMCGGCPVKEATGRVGCAGSPHEDWADYADSVAAENGTVIPCSIAEFPYRRRPKAKRLAEAELEFLKGLME